MKTCQIVEQKSAKFRNKFKPNYGKFETLCVRDLRIFAESIDGNVYHYRDKSDLECDAVVHLRNGSYGLIEIKLGGDYLTANWF